MGQQIVKAVLFQEDFVHYAPLRSNICPEPAAELPRPKTLNTNY